MNGVIGKVLKYYLMFKDFILYTFYFTKKSSQDRQSGLLKQVFMHIFH